MRFQIGTLVTLIDDVITGKIIAINNDAITIVTDDEFELTFDAKELVEVNTLQQQLSKYADINNPLLKQKLGSTSKKSKFKLNANATVLEVDLHIDQLLDNYQKLDKFDILNYQLDAAKQKLEWAMSKKIPKIVFIHGVGEGVLKSELQSLFSRYSVKFYDASYRKYGSGATEVSIL